MLALHHAFDDAGIPHAVGGALALAYSTAEPRGTRDIDINVFVPIGRAADVLAALPAGVAQPPGTAEKLARDEQIRLWWDDTPVDLFFDYAPIHEQARRNARRVPFAGQHIDVLGPVELAVFKAMFNRSRDWPDIEAMIRAGALDVDAVREALTAMLDPDDDRFARLDEAVRNADTP